MVQPPPLGAGGIICLPMRPGKHDTVVCHLMFMMYEIVYCHNYNVFIDQITGFQVSERHRLVLFCSDSDGGWVGGHCQYCQRNMDTAKYLCRRWRTRRPLGWQNGWRLSWWCRARLGTEASGNSSLEGPSCQQLYYIGVWRRQHHIVPRPAQKSKLSH